MYMLDTDICSYIIRMRPVSVLEKFKSLKTSDLCISVITQAELFYGVQRSSSKKINHSIIESFTSRLIMLDWDKEAAKSYGYLRASMEEKGKNIGNMDLMIAAHALSIGATIVTNNIRHFNMVEGLKIENWIE
jgi:tRNA(fMet)-specific endonuclease VapC